MYKFLCKAENFNKKQQIVKQLEENSIGYRAKASGPSLFSERDPKKTYWFRIYVNKADYPRALEIIGNV